MSSKSAGKEMHPNCLKNLEKGVAYQFTAETAAEAGRKGAEASAASRRKVKTMREAFQIIGALDCDDKEVAAYLEAIGIPATRLVEATLAVTKKAASGDIEAYKTWRDGIGESPKMQVGLAVEPATAEDLKGLTDAELARLAEQAVESDS